MYYLTLLTYRSHCIPETSRQDFIDACETFLGPPDLRSPSAPVADKDGAFIGGTHFERVEQPKPISPTTRAYTLAFSHQHSPNIFGTIEWGKINHFKLPAGQVPDNRSLRLVYLKVIFITCQSCIYSNYCVGARLALSLQSMLRRPSQTISVNSYLGSIPLQTSHGLDPIATPSSQPRK